MSVPDYLAQVEAARRVGLAMTQAQAEEFVRLLEAYAEDLAARVSAEARRGPVFARRLADEILREMVREMATSTGSTIRITADRVAEIYAEATAQLVESSAPGLDLRIRGGIGVQAAQAVLARPELSRAFVSVRRSAVATVDNLIVDALLRGRTSTQLAMALRVHIVGAEALPSHLLLDRRRIGYDAIRAMGYEPTPENLLTVRRMAGDVAARAQLIARTEPMNAEWEAHARSAEDSPVVAAHRWRLSSRHPKKDQCDTLQDSDFFGLGPGVYPAGQLPKRPHPRCICLQTDELRPVEEWGQTKPPPRALVLDPTTVGEADGLYPSQIAALLRAMPGGGATEQAA